MKKWIACFLLCALMLPIFGCQSDRPVIASPVTFYYQRSEFDHGSQASVILGETRESAGHETDIAYLINLYLSGPLSEEMSPTFPYNTRLLQYSVAENVANITVSNEFAQLTGIKLTVACACITKTVMELTGLETVHIQAKSELLGNDPFIVMNKESLLLIDSTEENN